MLPLTGSFGPYSCEGTPSEKLRTACCRGCWLSEVSDGLLFPLQRELTALQSVVATQEEELQVQASDIESLTRTIQMKEDLIKVRCCARLGEFHLGRLQRSLFVPCILRAVWLAKPDAIAAGLPTALWVPLA